MNLTEKHTFVAHGVDVVVVDAVVLEVVVFDNLVLEVVMLETPVLDVVVLGVVALEVVRLEVVVLSVVVLEVVVLEGGSGEDVVEVTKQEQAEDILDEELEQLEAISEGVGPNAVVIVYELQKAELDSGF